MATFSAVTSQHVRQALDEHDARGAEEFLALHGFTADPEHVILHEGRRYDARAVLAVAHRHATGRLATPEEFRSSLDQALTVLRRRGFEVTGPTTAPRTATRARTGRSAGTARGTGTSTGSGAGTTRSPARRASSAAERPAAVCPTCLMTLPATGICDNCS